MRLFLKTTSVLAVLIAVFFAGSGFSMAHHGYSCPMIASSMSGCPETSHSLSAGRICYEIVTKDAAKVSLPSIDYLPALQPVSDPVLADLDSAHILSRRGLELSLITGAEVGRKQIGFWIALLERKADADLS